MSLTATTPPREYAEVSVNTAGAILQDCLNEICTRTEWCEVDRPNGDVQ